MLFSARFSICLLYTSSIDLPWYKEWTGKAARDIKDNIKHVYNELNGKIDYNKIGQWREPLSWPRNDETSPVTLPTDGSR